MFKSLIERLEKIYNVSSFDDGGELSAVISKGNIIVNIYEMQDAVNITIEEVQEDESYLVLIDKDYKRVGSMYNLITKYLQ